MWISLIVIGIAVNCVLPVLMETIGAHSYQSTSRRHNTVSPRRDDSDLPVFPHQSVRDSEEYYLALDKCEFPQGLSFCHSYAFLAITEHRMGSLLPASSVTSSDFLG